MSITNQQRSKIYESVITVPATVGTGVTLSSDELYSFESYAFGKAKVVVHADDLSKVTDNVTVNVYVSFDEGTSWDLAASDATTIANGTGAATEITTVEIAPRIKVTLVTDGTGELDTGHGVKIDVQLEELTPMEGERNFAFSDTMFFAATEGPAYSNVVTCGSVPYAVYMIATADDLSGIDNGTGGLEYVLESSLDGVNYWEVTDPAKTDMADGTGELFSVTTESDNLGKYFRVKLYDSDIAGDAALTEATGARFALVTTK